MGVMIFSVSVRYDREIWAPPYVGLVTGSEVGDIRMLERPPGGTGLTLRDIHYNTSLQSRIPKMSLSGFQGIHLGRMNPPRLPSNQYEAMLSEFYILDGSPREIFENAKRIHPF